MGDMKALHKSSKILWEQSYHITFNKSAQFTDELKSCHQIF